MPVHQLRARAISFILRSPSLHPASHAPPLVSLHRLLSSAASSGSSVSSPRPFVAEDYLVATCGLTRAQALKASAKISHLKSGSKPDAVLAFLAGLGVSGADVAAIVAMDPTFLCADVEGTLAPRVADLGGLGLSRDDIRRIIPLSPNSFRNRFLRRNFEFWLAELGSFDKMLQVLRMNSGLLSIDLDKVAKPNLAFLRQCGLTASGIASTNVYNTRLFTMNPELLREGVERVEELGVERGAPMFGRTLALIALTSKEVVVRRIQLLRKYGFSQDDVPVIVRKAPLVLGMSDQKIERNLDFLIKDVGLEVPYIVRRPVLIMYSVEQRLLPRHCLLKALRQKASLKGEFDYYVTAAMSEKTFLQKYVLPYKDHVPDLVDGYASKCAGKTTARVTSL